MNSIKYFVDLERHGAEAEDVARKLAIRFPDVRFAIGNQKFNEGDHTKEQRVRIEQVKDYHDHLYPRSKQE